MKIRLLKSLIVFLSGIGLEEKKFIYTEMHSIQSEALHSDKEMVKGCWSMTECCEMYSSVASFPQNAALNRHRFQG